MKNSYVRLGGILFLIAAISAGLLAFLNDSTKDLIDKNEAMAATSPEVLEAVMPGSVMFIDIEDTALIDTIKAENAKFVNLQVAVDASNNELGHVVRTFSTVAGYGGDMELFVGISPDGKITGINVVSHSETSGLGSKTTEPDFISQFIGKAASEEIVEFDALAGVTKSSNSFLSAVNNAISIYSQYLK